MGERAIIIRGASLRDGRIVDVRLTDRILAIDPAKPLRPADGGRVIEARGGLLIPGLHDHHVHIAATAAALSSVRCGPPEVMTADHLAEALARAPGTGWLRGIGYHESVAGMIDRRWLDAVVADRPVRVQHRSGRMWIFNSAGLDILMAGGEAPEDLDREAGQLFDEDGWLRTALGSAPPDFAAVGAMLSRWGVTGVTDMNPQNGATEAAHFAAQHSGGFFAQRVVLAGTPALAAIPLGEGQALGPVKVHLHEAHLPDYDDLVATIREAHARDRAVAVHCVTETELVFTLTALREAGARAGDRIEHASVAPDALVEEIAALGLAVVAQPNFVAERGDAYLADIPHEDWPHLYRLRAFRQAGVTLAGGSDTPFGSADPWAAMAAAVSRRTAGGQVLGEGEALTAGEALDLFLADPLALGRQRVLAPGEAADLCLLRQDWSGLSADLAGAQVRATFIGGRLVHDRVDEPPV